MKLGEKDIGELEKRFRKLRKHKVKMKHEKYGDMIIVLPEDGKFDSTLIWLHGIGDYASSYLVVFYEYGILGVIYSLFDNPLEDTGCDSLSADYTSYLFIRCYVTWLVRYA